MFSCDRIPISKKRKYETRDRNTDKTNTNDTCIYLTIYIYYVCVLCYTDGSTNSNSISLYLAIDNIYEALFNPIQNDLFVFSIGYYTINNVDFLMVGSILFLGSILCVNLYQFNINVRAQVYNSFLSMFNFFNDFTGFLFLRRQNLTKQGNTKASLKIFKKK